MCSEGGLEVIANETVPAALPLVTASLIPGLVVNALDTGVPPAELARQIKPLIGLTERQAMAVEHFRTRMEDNPFGRTLVFL